MRAKATGFGNPESRYSLSPPSSKGLHAADTLRVAKLNLPFSKQKLSTLIGEQVKKLILKQIQKVMQAGDIQTILPITGSKSKK
jgi:hypothetical protein